VSRVFYRIQHLSRHLELHDDVQSSTHSRSAPVIPASDSLHPHTSSSTDPKNDTTALRFSHAPVCKMGLVKVHGGREDRRDHRVVCDSEGRGRFTAPWSSVEPLSDDPSQFEIAMEETEKATVYAEDDRAAAREELTKVQEAYKAVVDGSDQELAEEVKRRIGQRIRELEHGVAAMEEMALHQD